jgi:hypothetical protein
MSDGTWSEDGYAPMRGVCPLLGEGGHCPLDCLTRPAMMARQEKCAPRPTRTRAQRSRLSRPQERPELKPDDDEHRHDDPRRDPER